MTNAPHLRHWAPQRTSCLLCTSSDCKSSCLTSRAQCSRLRRTHLTLNTGTLGPVEASWGTHVCQLPFANPKCQANRSFSRPWIAAPAILHPLCSPHSQQQLNWSTKFPREGPLLFFRSSPSEDQFRARPESNGVHLHLDYKFFEGETFWTHIAQLYGSYAAWIWHQSSILSFIWWTGPEDAEMINRSPEGHSICSNQPDQCYNDRRTCVSFYVHSITREACHVSNWRIFASLTPIFNSWFKKRFMS